jgi:hypothetical protein
MRELGTDARDGCADFLLRFLISRRWLEEHESCAGRKLSVREDCSVAGSFLRRGRAPVNPAKCGNHEIAGFDGAK